MAKNSQNSSRQQSEQIQTNHKLWKNFNIKFYLQSEIIYENVLHGTIVIESQEARDHINYFEVVINDLDPVQFSPEYKNVTISGFDPKKAHSKIYLRAIPKDKNLEIKESTIQSFSIIRSSFSATPIIYFEDLSPNNNGKEKLVIEWFHIGDRLAQKYVICIDEKEIYHVRDTSIGAAYKVYIEDFEFEGAHTVEIIGRLNNGKETYRSSPIEFNKSNKCVKDKNCIINVSKYNGEIAYTDEDPREDTSRGRNNQPRIDSPKPQPRKSREFKTTPQILNCGCPKPHDEFPGIEHYFGNINTRKLSPNLPKKFNQNTSNQQGSFDDDEDVVM